MDLGGQRDLASTGEQGGPLGLSGEADVNTVTERATWATDTTSWAGAATGTTGAMGTTG